MISKIRGEFYDAVILQIMVPEIVDVSATDYTAKRLDKYGNASTKIEDTRPFVVIPETSITLHVETWLGKNIVWAFKTGDPPILLRKIIKDAVNNSIQSGIRIGY